MDNLRTTAGVKQCRHAQCTYFQLSQSSLKAHLRFEGRQTVAHGIARFGPIYLLQELGGIDTSAISCSLCLFRHARLLSLVSVFHVNHALGFMLLAEHCDFPSGEAEARLPPAFWFRTPGMLDVHHVVRLVLFAEQRLGLLAVLFPAIGGDSIARRMFTAPANHVNHALRLMLSAERGRLPPEGEGRYELATFHSALGVPVDHALHSVLGTRGSPAPLEPEGRGAGAPGLMHAATRAFVVVCHARLLVRSAEHGKFFPIVAKRWNTVAGRVHAPFGNYVSHPSLLVPRATRCLTTPTVSV